MTEYSYGRTLGYCPGCRQPSEHNGWAGNGKARACQRNRYIRGVLGLCGQHLRELGRDERERATLAAYAIGGWDAAIAAWLAWRPKIFT